METDRSDTKLLCIIGSLSGSIENFSKKSDIKIMNKKKAIIFTGGLGPEYRMIGELLRNAGISIAADSGWDLAVGMGVTPDYYIGDMDSISDHQGLAKLPLDRVMKYPVDKDCTDTELAIKFLEDSGYRDIVLIGGGGGRIDHLMALLALFIRPYRPTQWVTSTERILFVQADLELDSYVGQTISVFSNGKAALISSKGLKWELDRFELGSDQFSISNMATTDRITINVHKGSVLLILNF